MTKTISKNESWFHLLFWGLEGLFILIGPIYLYGWLKGLLIHNALSSLMHISGMMNGMLPVYKISKEVK